MGSESVAAIYAVVPTILVVSSRNTWAAKIEQQPTMVGLVQDTLLQPLEMAVPQNGVRPPRLAPPLPRDPVQ